MASGGGSHPSHLPITPHNSRTIPQSSSLQTPDTSSLFVSSLKGNRAGSSSSGGGGGGGGGSSFSPSPSLEHPQSFTSLEELLNVTGINSLELDTSKRSLGHDHGVNTLQQIAREVENSQGRAEPPSKRLCVNNTSHPTLNQVQVPSNIRVQSLHSPPTTTTTTTTTTRLPQTVVPPFSQHLTMPTATLQQKRDLTATAHLNSLSTTTAPPVASTHKPYFPNSEPHSSNLLPPPYNIKATPPIAEPTGLTSSASLGILNRTTLLDQFPSTQPSSQTQLLGNLRRQPLPPIMSQSSSPSLPNVVQTSASQNPGLSRSAENVNTNSKSVVLQLMQLYKQYQGLNDQQGMTRVRDQLNLLVSAQQKILAAQNGITKSDGGSPVVSSHSEPAQGHQMMSSSPKTGSVVSGANVVQGNQQQQRASRILNQLAMVSSQSQLSANGPWSNSGSMTTSLPAYSSRSTIMEALPPYSVPPSLSMTHPPPAYSEANLTTSSSQAASAAYVTGSTPNMPLSLLSHMGGSSAAPTFSQNQETSQADTQKAVKQIQMLMAALPDSKRPKSIQELKEFVQKYSSLVSKGPNSLSSALNNRTLPKSIPLPVNDHTTMNSSVMNTRTGSQPSIPPSSQMTLPSAGNMSQTSAAHVAEHFRNSLAAKQVPQAVLVPPQEASAKAPQFLPQQIPSSNRGTLPISDDMKLQYQSISNTFHAPVTDQFKQPTSLTTTTQPPDQVSFVGKSTASTTSTSNQSTSTGIQAGVATPLPPGLTLETLGVLCRLPEGDLLKLKLPQTLLSAIKVWKARQIPGNKAKTTNAPNKNNIPVLIPPSELSSSFITSSNSSIVNLAKPSTTSYHGLVGTGIGQPNVIPSGSGFPPRSLHAFVPGSVANMNTLTSHQTQVNQNSQQHMTRYKVKIEQQRAKTERLQALQKALQSSEEARIAYRFSAHLEKMHSQLMSPDTVSSFRSQHDVLARLLPYHLFAEPEPPPAAVEKADAVFESVAQVLLSRSRGLKSRFEQVMMKIEDEGGYEEREMKLHLERLFLEGERERIQKENLEKKEAEQIAANLSLMADNVNAFDPDFSFGDVFDPMMSMTGIT